MLSNDTLMLVMINLVTLGCLGRGERGGGGGVITDIFVVIVNALKCKENNFYVRFVAVSLVL